MNVPTANAPIATVSTARKATALVINASAQRVIVVKLKQKVGRLVSLFVNFVMYGHTRIV